MRSFLILSNKSPLFLPIRSERYGRMRESQVTRCLVRSLIRLFLRFFVDSVHRVQAQFDRASQKVQITQRPSGALPNSRLHIRLRVILIARIADWPAVAFFFPFILIKTLLLLFFFLFKLFALERFDIAKTCD